MLAQFKMVEQPGIETPVRRTESRMEGDARVQVRAIAILVFNVCGIV